MLNFITGVSGMGKTYRILNKLKCLAQKKQTCIFVVPEQFSTTAETLVYNKLGDELSSYVNVFSFTSLSEHLLKMYGGISLKTLSDAAAVVMVKRAVSELKDELKVYKSNTKNISIYSMLAQTFKEFKTAGATTEDVLKIGTELGEEGHKFKELALIFSAYNALVMQTALDSTDRINLAAQRVELDYLSDKYIFLDNFDGFTSPQYNMIEKLVFAKEITVSLCCDSPLQKNDDSSLFSPVALTARRLRRIAQKHMVSVSNETDSDYDFRHDSNLNLRIINKILCEQLLDESEINIVNKHNKSSECDAQNITLSICEDSYNELKIVATQIAKLKSAGVNYSDIVVICRQLERYRTAVDYEFNLAKIPFFADEQQTLEHTSHSYFLRCALQIAYRGLNSELILKLLKTNICGFEDEQIGQLENYVYTWQITPEEWKQPFVKSPLGFGKQNQLSRADTDTLEMVENVRQQVIPILIGFINSVKYSDISGSSVTNRCTAKTITKALYNLLISFKADENSISIANYLQTDALKQNSENIYKTWNTMMVMLDEMNELLKDDIVSAIEYEELFTILLRSYDIGHVPLTQDVVMVTTADRMKLENPKYCFVLGLNEGEFPKTVGYSGILTHFDRDKLVENGIDMPGSFEKRTMLEKMYFYRALTAPSHGLYLSALKQQTCGAPISIELAPVTDVFSLPKLNFSIEDYCSTPDCAMDMLYELYRENTPQSAAILSAVETFGEHAKSLHAMKLMQNAQRFHCTNKNAVKELIGNNLILSPTRIEKYYKCKFSYFLQYILKIYPRQKAQLSPIETGNIVHYILENTLRQAKENFINLSHTQLEEMANDITQKYVSENMPGMSSRLDYLVKRLENSAVELLKFLQEEQRQSSFYPTAFELSIGFEKQDIKPLTLKTKSGESITVVGKIDRVDVMKRDGVDYIRVVDYKTGDKNFRLDNVYCGIDIQMLFYLFTLCNTSNKMFSSAISAGALYIQADPTISTNNRHDAKTSPIYKVDGIVLDDEVVIKGMDKNSCGVFVPFSFSKKGNILKTSDKIASLEKLGNIKKHIEEIIVQMAKGLYEGEIDAVPLCTNTAKPCDYCDYKAVCRHEDGMDEKIVSAPKNVFAPIEK